MSIQRRVNSKGETSYRVRFQGVSLTAYTLKDARRVELELKHQSAMGTLHPTEAPRTLGVEMEEFIRRRTVMRNLREKGIRWYRQSAKLWAPFSDCRLGTIKRSEVEDVVTRRATEHPKSAKDELQVLKACLREAHQRGQKIDMGILTIPTPKHTTRVGMALTLDQVDAIAAWLPEWLHRIAPLAGTVGARLNVWLNLTDDMLDLEKRLLTVPRELSKNRKEFVVDLMAPEIKLLKEQMLARAGSGPQLFPTKEGKPMTHSRFYRYWIPACLGAGLGEMVKQDDGSERYVGVRFNDLRHTAASLMAVAKMRPEVAALRLGHTDGGLLYLKTYRHLYEHEAPEEMARFERYLSRLEGGLT